MGVMVYSGLFSPEGGHHPAPCLHEKLTGKPCETCGLSRSFSAIVRCRLQEARQWSPYGTRIFLFFFVQFFLRILVSLLIARQLFRMQALLAADIVLSVSLFLYCFLPLIRVLFTIPA